MGNKIKNYEERIANLGYELLDKYVKRLNRVIIKDEYGYKYDVTLFSLLSACHIPDFVSSTNRFSLNNISLWLTRNNKFVVLTDNQSYFLSTTKLKFLCLTCQEEFFMGWNKIYLGESCPFCAGKKVGRHNSLEYLNHALSKEWHPTKNGEFSPNEITLHSSKKAWWLCPICGHDWFYSIKERNRGCGCPKCNKSWGEKRIALYFDKNNIPYLSQYKFPDCKNVFPLPYDFYLCNIGICVEYQGKQHYEPLDFFGGERAFIKRLERDNIKSDYCKNNGIPLIIIPYWDFDNIEEILKRTMAEKIY
mgnify:CR=1 FL=1